jgi:hypothetical protein
MFKDAKKSMVEYSRNMSHAKKVEPSARAPVCKQPVVAPKGEPKTVDRTSELWQSVYRNSVATGHPFPEKMADSCVRSREKALALAAARPTSAVCDKRPPADNPKATPASVKKCRAHTLAGVPCGFAATCGDFCKRHAPAAQKSLSAKAPKACEPNFDMEMVENM